MNTSPVALQEISLRIKYESFAKLTTELSIARCYDDVAAVLRTNLKYIFDFQSVRLLVFYDSEQIQFDITRNHSTVIQSIGKIYPIESEVIESNLTKLLNEEKLLQREHDVPEDFRVPNAKHVVVYPLRTNTQHHLILTVSNKTGKAPVDSDYRFLRFVSEYLMSKVSQLILQERLEKMVKTRTEQLNEAHKELATLFYRASHDFSEPLTTLLGLTRLARLQLDKVEEIPKLLDHTEQVIGKAQKMLSKLKLISEAESAVRGVQTINLPKLVEAVVIEHKELAKWNGVHVSSIVTGDTDIAFSYDILETLLSNLVENAILFHRNIDNGFVRISIKAAKGKLTLRVEDNGQGIQEIHMKAIFEMYNRLNENSRGHGLGLYLVKKITEKLGGSIKVESVWGEGSVFEVRL